MIKMNMTENMTEDKFDRTKFNGTLAYLDRSETPGRASVQLSIRYTATKAFDQCDYAEEVLRGLARLLNDFGEEATLDFLEDIEEFTRVKFDQYIKKKVNEEKEVARAPRLCDGPCKGCNAFVDGECRG